MDSKQKEELVEKTGKMLEWLSDGTTWLGVFENHDLGHYDIGKRCCFPFSTEDGSFDKAIVGETRAPDGKHIGLGWRYLLAYKTKENASVAAHWLLHLENELPVEKSSATGG